MQLYKHNADTYKELCGKLQVYNKCGIIQCTGSGKGAIATKFVIDNMKDNTILLLAPQDSILNNYIRNFGLGKDDKVWFHNYAAVCRKSVGDLRGLGKSVDILILDEYHRCGAEKTEPAVKLLMETIIGHNGKVIGLTATPKRYLDGGRDMTQELFDGICVEGVDLTSAIKRDILPVFTYIKARYGFSDDYEKYKKYRREKKSKGEVDESKLSLIASEDIYIRDIIRKETAVVKGCQKWLVFCKSIPELQEIKYLVSNWFDKEVKIFEAHSGLSKDVNNKNEKAFIESHRPINVLLTVNKYNEGVHISDVSGVIMLRQTESPIIFLQQLGRALEAGKKQRPIIFDFVNNIETTSKYGDEKFLDFQLHVMANEINSYAERKAKKDPSKGGKIVIKSYCEDIDTVLNQIRKVTKSLWTPEQDEILKQYFETEKKDIVKRLPGRSWDAIYQRAKNLGLVKSRTWTLKEDRIIKQYYPIEGEGVVARLKNRTEDAVKTRASQLGVKKDKARCWKKEDDRLLILRYSEGATDKPPIDKMIKLLDNRFTIDQIFARFDYLGLNKNSLFEGWKTDEDQLLKALWNNWQEPFTYEDMLKRLGRHTESGILARARRLGLPPMEDRFKKSGGRKGKKAGSKGYGKPWTPDEDELLIWAFNEYGPAVYTQFPDRDKRSVDSRVYDLRVRGLIDKPKNKK